MIERVLEQLSRKSAMQQKDGLLGLREYGTGGCRSDGREMRLVVLLLDIDPHDISGAPIPLCNFLSQKNLLWCD